MNTTPYLNILKDRGFVPDSTGTRLLSPDALRNDYGCVVDVTSKHVTVWWRGGATRFTDTGKDLEKFKSEVY